MNEDIKIPKYQIIENDIIDQIHQGILKNEQNVPSEASLMAKYNCSRVTVRQALGNLQYKGFIYKKQGSGSYVKQATALHKHPAMKSFSEDMIDMGKKPSSQVTTFNITMAGENIAALLKIKKEDKVYYIERIRYAD
ncbi:MAG: GntR family transcriptional regulator, partial [Erysipelotrichaceae bacterium]